MSKSTLLDDVHQTTRSNIMKQDSDTDTFAFQWDCQPVIQRRTVATVPARPLDHGPDRLLDGKAAVGNGLVPRLDRAIR